MSKKITFKKAAVLGLISTTFAVTNVEIATLKSESASHSALNIEIGKSANAGVCNSRCAKRLSRIGGKIIGNAWRERKRQQQEQRE